MSTNKYAGFPGKANLVHQTQLFENERPNDSKRLQRLDHLVKIEDPPVMNQRIWFPLNEIEDKQPNLSLTR